MVFARASFQTSNIQSSKRQKRSCAVHEVALICARRFIQREESRASLHHHRGLVAQGTPELSCLHIGMTQKDPKGLDQMSLTLRFLGTL